MSRYFFLMAIIRWQLYNLESIKNITGLGFVIGLDLKRLVSMAALHFLPQGTIILCRTQSLGKLS